MPHTLRFEDLEAFLGREDGEKAATNRRELQAAKALLRRAIPRELTGRQQECVRLYYFQGLTEEETARRMGISRPTVCRHLQKARRNLQGVMTYAQAVHWNESED